MTVEQLIFYGFSALAILAASMVIFSRNPVRAVLFLVLTFFAAAGLWMLLEAEFLSITLILVYVGAVMVLFLFVVMMLDIELATIREGFTRYLPLGLCVAALLVVGLITAIGPNNFGISKFPVPEPHPASYSNVLQLGAFLYAWYLYPFLLAGVLLLVAIIAAISLTYRGRHDNKAPNPAKQVLIRKQDRVRLIKMPSEPSLSAMVSGGYPATEEKT